MRAQSLLGLLFVGVAAAQSCDPNDISCCADAGNCSPSVVSAAEASLNTLLGALPTALATLENPSVIASIAADPTAAASILGTGALASTEAAVIQSILSASPGLSSSVAALVTSTGAGGAGATPSPTSSHSGNGAGSLQMPTQAPLLLGGIVAAVALL